MPYGSRSAISGEHGRSADIGISGNNPGPPHATTGAQATLSLGDALILAIAEHLDYKVVTYDTYWEWMVGQGLSTAQVVVS